MVVKTRIQKVGCTMNKSIETGPRYECKRVDRFSYRALSSKLVQ